MTNNVSTDINKGVNRSLLTGILIIVLGIVAIAVPAISTLFAETWLALILLSAGAAKVVYAFQIRERGGFLRQAYYRATLNRAILIKANGSEVDLNEAFLVRADLRLANLMGANLRLADLTGADLSLRRHEVDRPELGKLNGNRPSLCQPA